MESIGQSSNAAATAAELEPAGEAPKASPIGTCEQMSPEAFAGRRGGSQMSPRPLGSIFGPLGSVSDPEESPARRLSSS